MQRPVRARIVICRRSGLDNRASGAKETNPAPSARARLLAGGEYAPDPPGQPQARCLQTLSAVATIHDSPPFSNIPFFMLEGHIYEGKGELVGKEYVGDAAQRLRSPGLRSTTGCAGRRSSHDALRGSRWLYFCSSAGMDPT